MVKLTDKSWYTFGPLSQEGENVITLPFQPQNRTRSGTGAGYNSPNMYWNNIGYILHSFGPEYTMCRIEWAIGFQNSNSSFELFAREFDLSSNDAINTAAVAPIPQSLITLNGPFVGSRTIQRFTSDLFPVSPDKVYNPGIKRTAGPYNAGWLFCVNFHFIKP